jgi:asparagine synthase (glutamine-hydrolysing)
VPVESWIEPRAADIAERLERVDEVRRVLGGSAAARMATPGRRWPLLFFAVWALIHLHGAQPKDALTAVVGEA